MPDLIDDLEALANKYRTLAQLRARREEMQSSGQLTFADDENRTRGAAFKAIAARFPGALRELQAMSADVLAERARVVEEELAAARRDPTRATPSPAHRWITIVLEFHNLLREALAVKLWLARRIGRDGAINDAIIAECHAWHETLPHVCAPLGPIDAASLALHHHPPGGRIVSLVWDALAQRHRRPRQDLQTDVFG